MQDIEIRTLYQQLGEVLRGLQALSDAAESRQHQTERMFDVTRVDLGVLRRDHSDLEEKLDCVICVMQHDLEELRVGAAAAAQSIDGLIAVFEELRKPVADIITLRSRAAGLILGFGILGSALLWLIEPFYRWFVEQEYLKH